MITKILIANRGEIALRIIATCKEMGIKTVTLYAPEEKELPHALESDESILLEGDTLAQTYLNQELIINLAKERGAQAIHPGYGFLSENENFAQKVEKEGLIFIGPRAETIALMGDKIQSKEAAKKYNLPIIPGYHGSDQSSKILLEEANKIGYPVLIKASKGGGGKGMRVVYSESEFMESLESAKREAINAFGDDAVLIEKFIEDPRHIEFQVLSDTHGNHLHLYERECSIQRRHQKIIEETPSVALDDHKRKEMAQASTSLTSGINYRGAGTIEYIFDKGGNFYFLEMNTRLQVEHPITEMITGVDLVKEQINIAMGKEISFSQDEIKPKGHSIEARLYAEDPHNDFLPSTGKIEFLGQSSLKNVRVDTGYVNGNTVSINYDPMLAKLIVWSHDRDGAIAKCNKALEEVVFLGLRTNRAYLKKIITHEAFKKGETFTHFVQTHKDELLKDDELSGEDLASLIGAFLLGGKKVAQVETKTPEVWDELQGFRNI